MSGIKPARRWQPAFSPFRKEKFSRRMLAKVELCVQGPLFGCRHIYVQWNVLKE
jgi:hypothetical protein